MAYSGLCLLQTNILGNLDVVALAESQGPMLNVACGIVTFVGLLVQYLVDRRRRYDYDSRFRGWSFPFGRGYGSYGRRGRSYRRAG